MPRYSIGIDLGTTHSALSYLKLEEGARGVDLDAVRAWCGQRVARYALPRRLVVLPDLPRSQVGKVLRRVVREIVLAMPTPAAGATTTSLG